MTWWCLIKCVIRRTSLLKISLQRPHCHFKAPYRGFKSDTEWTLALWSSKSICSLNVSSVWHPGLSAWSCLWRGRRRRAARCYSRQQRCAYRCHTPFCSRRETWLIDTWSDVQLRADACRAYCIRGRKICIWRTRGWSASRSRRVENFRPRSTRQSPNLLRWPPVWWAAHLVERRRLLSSSFRAKLVHWWRQTNWVSPLGFSDSCWNRRR